MMNPQAMVEEFHRKFDIAIGRTPSVPEVATRRLRIRLIQEEFEELQKAMDAQDLASVAKELADLLYVVYGTAVAYGMDMDPVFREVHRSNLSKVGGYKRADGKWMKPPTYSPAQVEPLLALQAAQSSSSVPPVIGDRPESES
ncbi:MAG TPA: MazG nucleotide pyrophosphohydrolase domain-containing protein [Nitrospira sp.]|jgi:predicted HAD superfamily Cof-like phosphohydrolase|nr:MazG nucleotide pyrophosphohydrolase domain-containing protein [Nitrospira sp.]